MPATLVFKHWVAIGAALLTRVPAMAFVTPLRVLVVDDHAGIRAGIAGLIDAEAPHMQTVGVAATAAQALAHARELQPDVVVLDVDLGGEDGLALIPALHCIAACEVVVLTSLADPQVAARVRGLGARACVQKTAPAAELIGLLGGIANARIGDGKALTPPASMGSALSRSHGTKHP